MNAVNQGRFLTVRTLTENDGESHDSIPIDLDEILRKVCIYLLIYYGNDLFVLVGYGYSIGYYTSCTRRNI
jgi:hypothetical protein